MHFLLIIDDIFRCLCITLPYLTIFLTLHLLIKNRIIKNAVELILIILLSLFMSSICTRFEYSFLELLKFSYEYYLSFLSCAIILRILFYAINKIYILK